MLSAGKWKGFVLVPVYKIENGVQNKNRKDFTCMNKRCWQNPEHVRLSMCFHQRLPILSFCKAWIVSCCFLKLYKSHVKLHYALHDASRTSGLWKKPKIQLLCRSSHITFTIIQNKWEEFIVFGPKRLCRIRPLLKL